MLVHNNNNKKVSVIKIYIKKKNIILFLVCFFKVFAAKVVKLKTTNVTLSLKENETLTLT